MTVKIEAKLTGWKETSELLKQLPNRVQRNVIKQAMDKAAKKVVDIAKASTAFQDRTGRLRKSIKVKRKKAESTRLGADVVCEPGDAPHAHLIEHGWMQRTANGHRHIPGRKFLTNALHDAEPEVLQTFETELKKFIERRLSKMRGS